MTTPGDLRNQQIGAPCQVVVKEGDQVKGGELLGFMGDSGYGEEEGTVGKFAVHLHLGIYIEDETGEEMSVNPYWVLKWLEGRRLKYQFS